MNIRFVYPIKSVCVNNCLILPYVVSGPIHSKLWQFYRVDEYFDIQNKNNRLQGYCKFAKNTRNIIADLMGTPGVEL